MREFSLRLVHPLALAPMRFSMLSVCFSYYLMDAGAFHFERLQQQTRQDSAQRTIDPDAAVVSYLKALAATVCSSLGEKNRCALS